MKSIHKTKKNTELSKIVNFLILLVFILILNPFPGYSQIFKYDVPRPAPSYELRKGKLEGDLLFASFTEDHDNYYVYEFKNNAWVAKGTIPSDISTGESNLSASENRVIVESQHLISVYEYKNGVWTKIAELTPDAGYVFKQSDIDHDRIVAHTASTDEDWTTYMNIYDFNGSNWIKTDHFLSVRGFQDDYFGYDLDLSGNHIAVSNGEASFVQLYTYTGGSWVKSDSLVSEFPEDIYYDFARAFDLEGNRLIINTAKGHALVYQYNGSHWIKTAQLNPADGEAGDAYLLAYRIELSGNLVAFNVNQHGGLAGALFEFREGHWIERSFAKEDDPSYDFVDLSLSGKNLLIDNNGDYSAENLYRIEGFQSPDQVKILASDGKENAAFGQSADIWSNKAIVGAPFDKEKGNSAGAAYIYNNDGLSWNEIIKLTATDASAGDRFGIAVSISGDYAAVGAPLNDDQGVDAGAAYLFKRQDGMWVQQAKLVASDAAPKDRFGSSVAISENNQNRVMVVVGSPYDDYGKYDGAGSAYVYYAGTTSGVIQEDKKITPEKPKKGDQFGKSVAIESYLSCYDEYEYGIVIGSPYDDEDGKDSGATYLYRLQRGSWDQLAKLKAETIHNGDRFGTSVDFNMNNIIVGAPLTDDDGTESGSAEIFTLMSYYDDQTGDCGVDVNPVATLTASDAVAYDRFGSSVAVSGSKAVVGSSYADHTGGTNAGAAYVYSLENGEWIEKQKFTGNARTGDRLGFSVSLSGSKILAGAYHDDDNTKGKDAGSAYIFDIYKISDTPDSPVQARTVTAVSENIKAAKKEETVVKTVVAGIREMKIYPNPFAQHLLLTLDQENAEPVEITLMDQLGRKLYQHQFTAAESQQLLQIDLTQSEKPIPPGMVFLVLKTSQGSSKWFKLVKH